MGSFLSLSAKAHRILRIDKNMAIRIERTIFRLSNISSSIHRVFNMAMENKKGTKKILTICRRLPLNIRKCSVNMERTSRKLPVLGKRLITNIVLPIKNKIRDVGFINSLLFRKYVIPFRLNIQQLLFLCDQARVADWDARRPFLSRQEFLLLCLDFQDYANL